MIKSIVGHSYEEAEAVVIGAPYEHTASFGGGAEDGPRAVKEILDEQLELFDRYTLTSPALEHKFGFKNLEEISRFSPEHMVKHVQSFLRNENRFYVLVGGVHSVTIPSLYSLAEKVDPSTVTVVQIDAHLDLRDDDSEYNEVDPSKYAHSTVMRRAHEAGFNILPVGIRTMAENEYQYAIKNGISFYEWSKNNTPIPTIKSIIDAVSTKYVYLTIDIDGFDTSFAPATGTPVPGGLSWEYGECLVRTLIAKKNVLAADVVEIAPTPDSSITEYSAAQIVYTLLSSKLYKE